MLKAYSASNGYFHATKYPRNCCGVGGFTSPGLQLLGLCDGAFWGAVYTVYIHTHTHTPPGLSTGCVHIFRGVYTVHVHTLGMYICCTYAFSGTMHCTCILLQMYTLNMQKTSKGPMLGVDFNAQSRPYIDQNLPPIPPPQPTKYNIQNLHLYVLKTFNSFYFAQIIGCF